MSGTVFPPGVAPPVYKPGDVVLTHGRGLVDGAIRFGQRLRMPAEWTWANHAALVVDADGNLIEALGRGVVRSEAGKYTPDEFILVDTGLSDEDRAEAVRFAEATVGTPYGWWTIASIALTLLTGARFRFDRAGTVICSGLCAAALGLDEWRSDPSHVMPGEIARRFGALPAAQVLTAKETPMSNLVASLRARWAALSSTARTTVSHAAVVAASVAATLSSLAAVLPAVHVPAADTAILTAVAAGISSAVTWLRAHHLAAAAKAAK